MSEAKPAVLDQIEPLGHAVIEASAGTGKTYTLEHLVVELVRRGTPIDRILVVTFTEKATREMRVRVRDRLAQSARGEPSLGRALASFDRAPISTIHGFCQRLLTEHAFASGRSFEPARVDGRAAFGRALRTTLRTADESVLAVLSAALGVMSLAEIEDCLAAFHRETCPVLPGAALSDVREALASIADATRISFDLETTLASIAHHAARPRARAELPELIALAGSARTEPLHAVLPALLSWALVTEGRKSAAERTVVALARSLEPDAALGPPLQVLARTIGSAVPLLVHEVLATVRGHLATEKRELGLFDYDDLLGLVLESLRGANGPALARAVRARYRHALVDEFQDTDERQWEIFRRLFFDPVERDDEARTSLAVIGDPKQAIYGFRGADVHTYARACAELQRGGARRAVLDRSFRTSAGLLEATHAIFLPPADAPPFFTGVTRYDAPVTSARPALRVVDARGGPVPALRLFHLVSENELRMKPARRALAAAYASEIEALLGGSVRVEDEKGPRDIGASDVFVLTRTSAEGDEIGDALRDRGIPYAFFRKDGLFATDEAKDVLDVLRALVSPRDRRARLRAYATAIFAVPLTSLADAAELPAEHTVRRTFDRLLTLSRARELAPLLRAISDETGLAQRELYLHATERRMTNYLHVLEVLLALSHRGRLSLRDLAERLAELASGRARASEDEDIQRLPSEKAAVQILTIHKAKGLEAEVVFSFGGLGQRPPSERSPVVMHGPASGTSDGRYAWAGPLPEAEKARFKLEDEQEAQRLYYVALTRAASLLYLPYLGPRPPEGVASKSNETELKLRGPYRVVNAQLQRMVHAGLDPACIERREIEALDVPRASTQVKEPAAAAATPSPLPRLAEGTTQALRHALCGIEVTSYSRMKAAAKMDGEHRVESSLDDAHAERSELLDASGHDRPPVEAPRASELPGGAAVGVMVHEILETLALDEVRARTPSALEADASMLELAAEAADRNGLPRELAKDALALAIRALKTPLRTSGLVLEDGLATPTRRLVEMPFVHPIPERAGVDELQRGYVRGVVDLLFEHAGKLYVLDWKSDRLDGYGEPRMREHVRAHYEVQVRLYTLACARAFGLKDQAEYDARFGGLLYVFVRGLDASGAGALFRRPTHAEVLEWEGDLASSEAPWGYPLPPRRAVSSLGARMRAPWVTLP
jgi:exodeoxyribonuclease V beta subunit